MIYLETGSDSDRISIVVGDVLLTPFHSFVFAILDLERPTYTQMRSNFTVVHHK